MVGFCFRIPKVHSHCYSCKKPFVEAQPLLSYLKEVDGHMVSLVDILQEEQVFAWLSSEVFEEIKLLLENR